MAAFVTEQLRIRRFTPEFFHRTPEGEPIWLDSYKYAILREEFSGR